MDCKLILMPAYNQKGINDILYNNGCANILCHYSLYNIMKHQDAFHGSNLKHSTVYTNKTVTCYNLIGAKNMV